MLNDCLTLEECIQEIMFDYSGSFTEFVYEPLPYQLFGVDFLLLC
jgi:hypothetical protein